MTRSSNETNKEVIEWPNSWRTVPLWSLFARIKEVDHPNEEMLSVYREHGVVKKKSRTDNLNKTAENKNIYQLIENGWFVVNRMKAWQGSVGVSPYRGIVSGHYLCFKPQHDEEPRFLNWLLRSDPYIHEYRRLSRGVRPNQIEIDNDGLRSVPIRLPSLAEQRRIADFLDREVARLERLDHLRARTITLFEERAIVEIDGLVRGTDKADKKPAEYAPLGLVPHEWVQARLRSIDCAVQTGPFGSQLHAEDYIKGGYPVINPTNITPEGLVADPLITVSAENRERLSRHTLRRGDIVFGRRGELGRAGVVTQEQEGWLCGTGCLRVRFRTTMFHPDYLRTYLSIPAVRYYFHRHSVGSTMPNLSSRILLGTPLLVPPYSTQERISQSCKKIEKEVRQHVSLLDQQRKLLSERKNALITAAVTGQIDTSTASGRAIED